MSIGIFDMLLPAFFIGGGSLYSLKTIIFTDLDGTLLHPETYSFEAARPALDLIRAKNIPLVLCSSKTRAEQELIRKRLANDDPFIVENGGGIFVPRAYFSFPIEGEVKGDYTVVRLGAPYQTIRKEFVELRKRFRVPVAGFGDMTLKQIAEITGLSSDEAAYAADRDFGEAFVFEKGFDQGFLAEIERRGLHWTRGRLYHVLGNHDKGKAVHMLKKWYEREHGKIITIGLGDALNDLPLFKEVDYPVLVQKDDGSYDPNIDFSGLIKAKGAGPAGWNESILQFLHI